jgi:hypothetical protein
MSDDNPYASPQAELLDSPPDQWEGDVRDCWRDGTLLVVCPTTVLPYRCVKTNEPAVGKPIRMSCDRTPPVLVLVLMPTMCIFPPIILVFVVVALVCRWSFTVRLPLGRRWRSRRRRAYGVGVLGTIALVALLVWSGQRPAGQSWGATIVAMLGLLALIVWSAARSSVLRQYRTRRGYVWLKGAHADFLASLPDWPLERW